MKETATFEELEHLPEPRIIALLLNVMLAYCFIYQSKRNVTTYVVQSLPVAPNVMTWILAFCPSVGKLQQALPFCGKQRLPFPISLRNLEVREIEDWIVASRSEVDKDVGPWMVHGANQDRRSRG